MRAAAALTLALMIALRAHAIDHTTDISWDGAAQRHVQVLRHRVLPALAINLPHLLREEHQDGLLEQHTRTDAGAVRLGGM